MKTFQISYDPEQNKGIYALSVVKSPAMESKFITLKDASKPIKLATISDERRAVSYTHLTLPTKRIV